MNRDETTQNTLIAIARTLRVQRSLAYADVDRLPRLPTLHRTLGYMTSTATIAGPVTAGVGHTMSLLGVSRSEGVAYVVEERAPDAAPIAYRLWLHGPRAGHLAPIQAWCQPSCAPAEVRARIETISTTLEPAGATLTEAWMLSTRVVQRRAVRVASHSLAPVRTFALQLQIEPVTGHGPSGHTTVTAFLRPGAHLAEVWSVPGESSAIARVTFTGHPEGLGLPRDTMVLLAE